MKDGELLERDGRFELRFVRELDHPVARVWEAVTSPEGLSAWFPFDVVGERRAGAALEFVFRAGEGAAVLGLDARVLAAVGDGASRGRATRRCGWSCARPTAGAS